MQKITYQYFALALFKDTRSFEIRLIKVDGVDLDDSLLKASQLMSLYARDFSLEFSGKLCVFEAGSDMFKQYGEAFSLTCDRDITFESAFENKLGSSLGIRSISS